MNHAGGEMLERHPRTEAGCSVLPPPPPRAEPVPEPRAGLAWVPGYWNRAGERFVWVVGRWVPERRGFHWQRHRWVLRDNVWHLKPGGWAPG